MTTRSIIAKRVAVLATSLGVLAGASPASAAPSTRADSRKAAPKSSRTCVATSTSFTTGTTGNDLGRVKGSGGLAVLPRPHHGNERVHQPGDRQVVQQCVRAPTATTSR